MPTSDLHYLTKITYKDYGTDQDCYIDPMRAELVAAVLKDVKSITDVELHRYVFVREEAYGGHTHEVRPVNKQN